MSKRKTIISSEDSDVSVSGFHNSVSYFRAFEEKALKINVNLTSNFEEIVRTSSIVKTDLELMEFNQGEIFLFTPERYPDLNVPQTKFLDKLRRVVVNNNSISEETNFEKLIDDLVVFLYDHLGFDNGKEIIMKSSNLTLNIGENNFAAHADREGRRRQDIIWIVLEEKHVGSRSYKKGELQLVCCMLAAYQYNYTVLNDDYPPSMIGIRIVGDKFYFYSMKSPKEYLEDLFDGLPKRSLEVIRYPKENGLALADSHERVMILRHLCSIRDYALSLEK